MKVLPVILMVFAGVPFAMLAMDAPAKLTLALAICGLAVYNGLKLRHWWRYRPRAE